MKTFQVKTMTATFTVEGAWAEGVWLDLAERGIQDVISVREVRHG